MDLRTDEIADRIYRVSVFVPQGAAGRGFSFNHFLIDGSDHVANVAGEWRSLFGATAVLLLLSEAAGVAIGMWAGSAARSGVGD